MNIIDDTWNNSIDLLKSTNWRIVKKDIINKISFLNYANNKDNYRIHSLLLVLATLEQKYGSIEDAKKILLNLENSEFDFISNDAKSRVAKIFSQTGDFLASENKLLSIISKNSNKFSNSSKYISPSAYWRIGFLKGIRGEIRESNYFFDKHLDLTIKHSSQYANNIIFQNLYRIKLDDFNIHDIFKKNEIGFNYYLKDSISVTNVKYVSVSKSIIVPILLDSIVKLKLHDYFSATIQLLLCKRLIDLEDLTYVSEGIGETISALKLGNDKLISNIITYFEKSEKTFLDFLIKNRIIEFKSVEYMIQFSDELFKDFLKSSDFKKIKNIDFKERIIHSGGYKMNNKNIFIIHGHDELNLYKLKDFINNDLKLNAIVLKNEPGKGQTIIEKFESLANKADYAIALFTNDDIVENNNEKYLQARPNVIFEIGWFYGKLGREKVIILYQKNVKIPSDLHGISSIEFEVDILEKAIEIKKEII